MAQATVVLESHICQNTGLLVEAMLIALMLTSLWRIVRYKLVGTALVGVKHAIGNAAAMVVGFGDIIE